MRRDRIRLSAVILAAIAAAPCLLAAKRAEAFFRYMTRKNLSHELEKNPDKWVDTDVTVTDELAYVWPADPAGELDTEKTQGTKCVRFDTVYFRCAVDVGKKGDYLEKIWEDTTKNCKDILDEIQGINADERAKERKMSNHAQLRKDAIVKLVARFKAKPLVTVFGKVARVDFYTPNFYLKQNANEEFKGKPESLTILCERVEKPRDRYYEHGLDDTDD
ncbi:MAG TPA: hypothetical protein VFF73_07065 [Planctomycetota bacterium]|nr:hypothetical protein [Planctomycetota bacterium]